MNNMMLAGRLGSDPEVRYTSSGQKVTTFRLATNSRRGGKDETIWWRITIWGEQFDKMMPYLKKGSAVIVHGELSKPEIYNNREGNPAVSLNVTATSLAFSPFGKASSEKQEPQNDNAQAFSSAENYGFDQASQGQAQESESFSDEEIPF